MTQTINAIYENNVLKPLTPIFGIDEHQRIEITLSLPHSKKGSQQLAGTLTNKEAREMETILEQEFETIENDW